MTSVLPSAQWQMETKMINKEHTRCAFGVCVVIFAKAQMLRVNVRAFGYCSLFRSELAILDKSFLFHDHDLLLGFLKICSMYICIPKQYVLFLDLYPVIWYDNI